MSITVNINSLIFFLIACSSTLLSIEYSWKIEGTIAPELANTIKSDAPIARKEAEISSLFSLQHLANTQATLWTEELHSRAYFNAKVDWVIRRGEEPFELTFHLDPGPVYLLEDVELDWLGGESFPLKPENLGLKVGDVALPSLILEAEERLLQQMALKGYPLARVVERKVFADEKRPAVRVIYRVAAGQEIFFGATKISGNGSVDSAFIKEKVSWKEGKKFDPARIEQTQEALEATGLFNSVVIKEGEVPDNGCAVPLEIELTERKHRTIAGGIGYSTQQGPGLSAEWQHRNLRGRGEQIDIQAKAWSALQTGLVEYTVPAFCRSNEDLRLIGKAEHETTKGYTETSLSFSSLLDRRINDWTSLSYGLSYKLLRTSHSNNNGTFNLLQFPMQLKWSTADDTLDPTKGFSLNVRSLPSFQLGRHSFGYWTNTATGTFYCPLNEEETIIFASKLTAGTILGASRREIPPSERFYSGTENTLRGYKFMSVSPLDDKHKPTGGKSMIVLSTEARWRCTEKIGLAAFYEVGNVYANPFPDLDKGVLQSIGAGLRYNTPIGPVRFDVAVPLNRRPHVDPPFQFYMSIGQSF